MKSASGKFAIFLTILFIVAGLTASRAALAQTSVNYAYLINEQGTPQSTFDTPGQYIGIEFGLNNLPAGSIFEFKYLRPDGSVSADYTTAPNNPYYWVSTWGYVWGVGLDALGTWTLQVYVNGVPLISLPFTVVLGPVYVFDNAVIDKFSSDGNENLDRQTAFATGWQLLGLQFQVENLPAYSSLRLRYQRPDGSIAADTGTLDFDNGTWYPYSYWYQLYWVNLNVSGIWHLLLDINGVPYTTSAFDVGLVLPTKTALASSQNPATFGTAVTFTATVTSQQDVIPSGNVVFSDAGIAVAQIPVNSVGQATYTTSSLATGTHPITATYVGTSDLLQSSSASLNQTINMVPTTTVLTSSLNPAIIGAPVTFTTTVTSDSGVIPTGLVVITDTLVPGIPTVVAKVVLDATGKGTFTTSTLGDGQHSLKAEYIGTPDFQSSRKYLTQNIERVNITVTNIKITRVDGNTVSLTCTVSNVSDVGDGIMEITRATLAGTPTATALPVEFVLLHKGQKTITLIFHTATKGKQPFSIAGTVPGLYGFSSSGYVNVP